MTNWKNGRCLESQDDQATLMKLSKQTSESVNTGLPRLNINYDTKLKMVSLYLEVSGECIMMAEHICTRGTNKTHTSYL